MTRNSFLAVMVLLTVALSGCDQTPTTPTPPTPTVYAETSGLSPDVRQWALTNANVPRYGGRIARWTGVVRVYVYPNYTPNAAQRAIDFWNNLLAGSGVSLQLVSTAAEAQIQV